MFPNTIHLHTAQACKRGVCLYIVALVFIIAGMDNLPIIYL